MTEKERKFYERFGTIVRQARLRKNIQVRDILCPIIGTKMSLWRIENGKNRVKMYAAAYLCKVLDIKCDFLGKLADCESFDPKEFI